jgi:isoamylase
MAWQQWPPAGGEGPQAALLRFASELIAFRKSHPALGREAFLR